MAPSRQTLSYADESPAVDSAAEATSAAQQVASGPESVSSLNIASMAIGTAEPISISRVRGVASELQQARYLASHPFILGSVPIPAPPAAALYADAEDALTTGASGFYVEANYEDGLSKSLLFAEGTFRSRFPGFATVYHSFSQLSNDDEKDAMLNWLTSFRIAFTHGKPADLRARVERKALVDYGGKAASKALVLFLDNAENMLHWDVTLINTIHDQLYAAEIALLTFSGLHTAGLGRLTTRFEEPEAAGVRLSTVLRMRIQLQAMKKVDHFAEMFRAIDNATTPDGRSWTSAFLPSAVKAHFKLENEAERAFKILSKTKYTTRNVFECVRRFLKLATRHDVEAFAPPGINDALWLAAARLTPLVDDLPELDYPDLSAEGVD
jgi:hypothetical protein